jgi:hypothetical protein
LEIKSLLQHCRQNHQLTLFGEQNSFLKQRVDKSLISTQWRICLSLQELQEVKEITGLCIMFFQMTQFALGSKLVYIYIYIYILGLHTATHYQR